MRFVSHPWRPPAAAFLVNGTLFGIWSTQIPLMKDRLGLSPAALGLMLLCGGLGAVAAMSGSGWLLRRLGTRTLMVAAGVPFCVLVPLASSATLVPLEAVLVALLAATGGTMDVVMNAQGTETEGRTRRAMMSSFHGMWSLGGLVGAGLGGLLLGVVSGPVQASLAGVLGLGALLASQRHAPAFAPPAEQAYRRAGPARATMRRAVLIGLVMTLCFSAEGVVFDWSALYLRNDLGTSRELASLGYASFAAAMAAMRFAGDRIKGRVGGVALVRVGAVLSLVGVALGPLTGQPVLAVLGYAIAGLGMSNVVPVLFSAAGALPNAEMAIATASTLGYAGMLVAPPLLGFVANEESYGAVFVVAALLFVVIALAGGLARHPAPAADAGEAPAP